MELKRVPRDISRWIRKKTGTFGRASGRLARDRESKPLALSAEHVANAKIYASRYDFMRTLPHGGVAAEVGTQNGKFAAFILETVKPDKLHLFDLSFEKLRDRFAGNPIIACHQGDAAQQLGTFADRHFDWIYIDAGHEYKDVRRDATTAARKIKPDGLLIFNDYIIYSHHEGFEYGVVQTVNEMCVNEGWEIVAYCLHQNLYCDIALRKRS